MMNALRLFVAIAVPAALLMAGNADAGKGRKGKRGHWFHAGLVKSGALEKGSFASLKPLKQAWKACRADVKAGKAAKGSCLSKKLEIIKAKLGLYEKAKASGKAVKRLARKLNRKIKKLGRKIKRIERKLAKMAAPK